MGLIARFQYNGEFFRIGKALSPNLPKRYRSGWVYGKLVKYCQGDYLPLRMWEVWKKVRNKTFHFFPGKWENISLEQAKYMVDEVARMMEESLLGCRVTIN